MSWGELTISAAEMMIIDENTEWLGVPRLLLMENAGAEVARLVSDWLGGAAGKQVVVFCGTGNNGGDGFAAARHLAGRGAQVTVVLVGNPERVRTTEAKTNLEAVKEMRASVKFIVARSIEELRHVKPEVERAEAIIDAIFGTGIRGAIREPWRTAIEMINSARGLKVAVDVPSGVDPDTGNVEDLAVKADVTVTLHLAKRGLPAAADHCGELVVAPIGIPPEAALVMGPGDLRAALIEGSLQVFNVVMVEEEPGVEEVLEILGTRYRVGSPEGGNEVTYLPSGSGWPGVKGFVVSDGLRREASLSVVEGEVEKNLLHECEAVRKLSEENRQTIYLLSSIDFASDGFRCKVGWKARPLGKTGRAVLKASILFLLSRKVKPLRACAAAGYLAGFAEEHGLEKLTHELTRLSPRH